MAGPKITLCDSCAVRRLGRWPRRDEKEKKKKKAERRGGGGVVLASGSITNKIKGIRESGMFYDGGHETPLCPWIVKF